MTTEKIFERLAEISETKKVVSAEEKELKAELLPRLQRQVGTHKSIRYETGVATLVADSESIGFDEKAFAIAYPELYAQFCTKVNKRAGGVKFTPLKKK